MPVAVLEVDIYGDGLGELFVESEDKQLLTFSSESHCAEDDLEFGFWCCHFGVCSWTLDSFEF